MAWPTTNKIYVLGSLASFPVATVTSGDPPSPRTAVCYISMFAPTNFFPFIYFCRYRGLNPRLVPRPLQKSTNILFEYSVPLSVRNARGTPISTTKRFTTEKMAAALFSRAPYVRCRREALSTRSGVDEHNDVPRPPERSWVRSSGVDVDTSQRPRRSPRRVIWSRCPIHFRPRAS